MSNPKSPIPSDDEVRERRIRYAHHVPDTPLRTTRVPAVLADAREFRDLAAEREAVLEAEAGLGREHADLVARNEVARAEHQAAQRDAMLSGGAPPPPLHLEPWPWPQHPRVLFDEIHAVIEGAELGLLDEHADRWADDLAGRVVPLRERLGEARKVVADLEAEAAPLERALEALTRDQRVQSRVIPPTGHHRGGQTGAESAQEIQVLFDESRRPPRSRARR
jgi:hypothetical protein